MYSGRPAMICLHVDFCSTLCLIRFRNALTPVYFRRSDAFVIVYDVTNRASFKSSKSWLSIVSVS